MVIDPPNAGARGLGIAAIIGGGVILGAAFVAATVIDENCRTEGNAQCQSQDEAVPYVLGGYGAGLVLTAVGIVLVVANNKPSVEVLPAHESRARREPGTFVSLGPVEGSTLPGLSLRGSF
jgi:hypothetical protein